MKLRPVDAAVGAIQPADAATATPDAAEATAPPLHKADSWLLVRRADKLTPFACMTSSQGAVSILEAKECVPIGEDKLAAFDASGKAVTLKRADASVSCRANGWDPYVDLPTFELESDRAPPPLVFYPRAPASPPLALKKKWVPKPAERKEILGAHPKSTLDPFAIVQLDKDPELERLAIVTTTHRIDVGHGHSAGTLVSKHQALLLDEGDGTFETISEDPDRETEDALVTIAAATDLDADGFRELWVEVAIGEGIWEVYEVTEEDGVGFLEDCKSGHVP